MCFSIPYKIIAVEKSHVIIEGGRNILCNNDNRATVGAYAQVSGDVVVGILSKKEGLAIRKLIKSLN